MTSIIPDFLRRARGLIPVLMAWGLTASAAELTFDAWSDAFARDWVQHDPELATTTQYFEGAEQDSLDRKLTPVTQAFRAERVAQAKRGLTELDRFDAAGLNESQWISAAMLRWQLEDIVRAQDFEDFRLIFQQFSGLQVQLVNFLTQTHPIRNRRDIQNWRRRSTKAAPRQKSEPDAAFYRRILSFIRPSPNSIDS